MSPPDRPTLVNRKANRAAGVHTRKSAASAITAPAPAAIPCTAAMIGTGQSRISRMTSPLIRVKASSSSSDMASVAPMISLTSPPEQNDRQRQNPAVSAQADGRGETAGPFGIIKDLLTERSGSERWPRRVIRPTGSPLRGLAMQLADFAGADPVSVYQSLSATPGEASMLVEHAVRSAASHGADPGPPADAVAFAPPRLVLVVDQFEELFTARRARPMPACRRSWPGPPGQAGRANAIWDGTSSTVVGAEGVHTRSGPQDNPQEAA